MNPMAMPIAVTRLTAMWMARLTAMLLPLPVPSFASG